MGRNQTYYSLEFEVIVYLSCLVLSCPIISGQRIRGRERNGTPGSEYMHDLIDKLKHFWKMDPSLPQLSQKILRYLLIKHERRQVSHFIYSLFHQHSYYKWAMFTYDSLTNSTKQIPSQASSLTSFARSSFNQC